MLQQNFTTKVLRRGSHNNKDPEKRNKNTDDMKLTAHFYNYIFCPSQRGGGGGFSGTDRESLIKTIQMAIGLKVTAVVVI